MITSINEYKKFLESSVNTEYYLEDVIKRIKNNFLIMHDLETWEEFIDQQQIGDCQGIVADIVRMDIDGIEKHFGKIRIDAPQNEEDFDKVMTHHWITLNGLLLEFSKGSLRDWVNFNDIYSVDDEGEIEYLHEIEIH